MKAGEKKGLPEVIVKVTVRVFVFAGILLSFLTGAKGESCARGISETVKAETAFVGKEEKAESLDYGDNRSFFSREDIRKEYEREVSASKESGFEELELEKEVEAALERNNDMAEEEIEKVRNCKGNYEAAKSGLFRMETEEYNRKIYGLDIRVDAVLNGGKREKDPVIEEKRVVLKKELNLSGICARKEAEVNIYEQYMYIRGVTGGRGLERKDIV